MRELKKHEIAFAVTMSEVLGVPAPKQAVSGSFLKFAGSGKALYFLVNEAEEVTRLDVSGYDAGVGHPPKNGNGKVRHQLAVSDLTKEEFGKIWAKVKTGFINGTSGDSGSRRGSFKNGHRLF
jgi:hypothetical protein